jgi:hypothetical protein
MLTVPPVSAGHTHYWDSRTAGTPPVCRLGSEPHEQDPDTSSGSSVIRWLTLGRADRQDHLSSVATGSVP